jgi:putative tryptophan/tyrosine transport system substrate-binding protein
MFWTLFRWRLISAVIYEARRSPESSGKVMRRRDFIALLGGTAAASSGAWPLAAQAQQSVAPVVGVLAVGSPRGFWAEMFTAFRQGLGDAGYSEGRDVTIEACWAEDHYDRLPALATALVGRRPTVIGAFATAAAKAAKAATANIPIVFVTIGDPVQIGLVASLNRPGGNMTGVSLLSVAVGPKLLELLHEAVPSAHAVGLLLNPTNPNSATQSKSVQAAAQRLGLQLHVLNASNASDFDPTFAKLRELQVAALIIGQDVLFGAETEQLAKLSDDYRIPTIDAHREFAVAGGLMSYGANERDAYRQAGNYAGRILKGEKPSDLPVIQVVKLDLVINLKAARALDLNTPLSLLGRADEVIE